MKKKLLPPRLCFLLLLLMQAGSGYAVQGVNFNWAESFDCYKGDKSLYLAAGMAQDDSGYLYTTVVVDDTSDVNPGPGTELVYPQPGAYYGMAILKLTREGQLVWAKRIIADTYIQSWKLVLHNGSLYVFGSYRTNADFDPSAGTAYVSGNASQNTTFVAKYTLNGDYVFAKNMAASNSDVYIGGVAVNSAHRFIIGGTFARTTDFDPSAGVVNLDPVKDGYYDGYIASYDSDFTNVAVYRIGGATNTTGSDFVEDVAVDNADNVYVVGYTGSAPLYTDFVGANGQLTSGNTVGNGFVARYNNLFQWQGAYIFNSTATNLVDQIVVNAAGIFMNVRCDGGVIDFDPSGNTATSDFNTFSGRAIVGWDVNGAYSFHKAWHGSGVGTYISFSSMAMSYNRILLSGFYNGSNIDLDPDVPVVNAPASTVPQPFAMLLNGTGNLVLHTELSGNDARTSFATFDKQSDQYFYFAGYHSDTLMFGPTGTTLVANKNSSSYYNAFLSRYDLLDIPPDTASKAMVFSNVTDTTMTVSFTPGNGDKRLVLCRAMNAVDTVPADAIYYSADTVFAHGSNFDGRYAVYNDVGHSFTVTGLSPNTMYYFEVFEFNGFSSQINFLTSSTLTGNHKTTLNGSTGIADMNHQGNFVVYPNPARNYLILESTGMPQESTTVQIFDLTGKTMLQQKISANSIQQIDVSLLSSGIYFVEIRNGTALQTTKFIKE